MKNRELLNMYVVCGKIKNDVLSNCKYNLYDVLESDISIKEFLDLYLLHCNDTVLIYLLRIGSLIVNYWGDDREYCKARIKDIYENYKICLRYISNFNLIYQLKRINDEMVINAVGLKKHIDYTKIFKGDFEKLTSCMIKYQRIDLDNPIILNNRRHSIIEDMARHFEQRVFMLNGCKEEAFSIMVVKENDKIEFISEMNTEYKVLRLKELLMDKKVKLVITLTNSYEDSWNYRLYKGVREIT